MKMGLGKILVLGLALNLLGVFLASGMQQATQALGGLQTTLVGLQTNLVNLKGSLSTLNGCVDDFNSKSRTIKSLDTVVKSSGNNDAQESSYYSQLPYFDQNLKDFFSYLDTIEPLHKPSLEDHAVKKGFGYKTANLTALNAFAQEIKLEGGCVCAVPEFVGISDAEIKDFLRECGFDVVSKWDAFKVKENLNLKDSLAKGQYPDGFLAALKKDFEHEINTLFTQKLASIRSGNEVDRLLALFNKSAGGSCLKPETITGIRSIHTLLFNSAGSLDDAKRLMVRSTGKEDTDTLANAGGNESIANVKGEAADIFKAIGDVVVSYFMEKSMQQRLGANDPSIFDVPFTPVLIQRMIGETPRNMAITAVDAQAISGNKITRCGVMFTEELEGGISAEGKKWPNGKVKTSGITLIQASYGHNEGVVNSLVPVDTYYIANDGNVHYVVKNKTHRKVPATANPENKKLFDLPNPSALIGVPALNQKEIKSLKKVANALEHFYKQPMDVEFVIDYSRNPHVIYIVQARPLVHKKNRENPSYLDPDFFDAKQATFNDLRRKVKNTQKNLDVIGVGGGAVRCITDRDHCIVSKTIGEALTINNKSSKKRQIEAVIVGQMAPATSHEATTFRGEGKLVLCAEDVATYRSIAAMLQAVGSSLVVDAQQGACIQLLGELTNQEKQLLIKSGWINYPIPLLASVVGDGSPIFIPYVMNRLGNKLETKEQLLAALSLTDIKDLTFTYCIRILRNKSHDVDLVGAALKGILLLIQELTTKLQVALLQDERLLADINKLSQQSVHCIKDIQNCFRGNGLLDEQCYRFKVRILEALLLQQPTETQVLAGNSWTLLLKGMQKAKKIHEKIGVKPTDTVDEKEAYRRLVEVTKLKDHALTPELANKWTAFVGTIKNASKNEKIAFYGMVKTLLEANLFDTWLHKFFAAECDKPNCLSILLDIFNKSENFLKLMTERLKTLEALDLKAIGSPKAFKSVWESFYNDQVVYFTTPYASPSSSLYSSLLPSSQSPEKGFLNDLKDGSELQKLACLVLMEKFITVFDGAIKMVEESSEFVVSTLCDIPLDKDFLLNSLSYSGREFNDVSLVEFLDRPTITGGTVAGVLAQGNKVFAVKVLLFFYLKTLCVWWEAVSSYPEKMVTTINGDISGDLNNLYKLFFGKDYSEYSTTISCDLFKTNTENSIKPTVDFNVASATIGSGAIFVRGCPQSLEDLFTFTHQSMLAIFGALYNSYGLNINMPALNSIPEVLVTLNNSISSADRSILKPTPSLQGANFSNRRLELNYNWSQRAHSAMIRVGFSAVGKTSLTIGINIFGADHYGRWSRIADYLAMRSHLEKVPCAIELKEKGVELTWTVELSSTKTLETQLELIINFMRIVSARGNYSVAGKEFLRTAELGSDVILSNVKAMLIALSAEDERILWGLSDVLTNVAFYSRNDYALQETDYTPEIVKNMLIIATKLSDTVSDYYAKSIILLHKFEYAPQFTPEIAHVYYGLTKNNYEKDIKSFIPNNSFEKNGNTIFAEYQNSIRTMLSFILQKIIVQGSLRYGSDAGVQPAYKNFIENGLPLLVVNPDFKTDARTVVSAIMMHGSVDLKQCIKQWKTKNFAAYNEVGSIPGVA